MKNVIKWGLLLIAACVALVIGWLSLSLVWYPKFEEMDTAALTKEADIILADCDKNGAGTIMPVFEVATPYIYSFVENKGNIKCSEGVYLPLWNDYMMAQAGLYVANAKNALPDWIAPYVTQLDGRVYKWHGAIESAALFDEDGYSK